MINPMMHFGAITCHQRCHVVCLKLDAPHGLLQWAIIKHYCFELMDYPSTASRQKQFEAPAGGE